jgi:hypothetical protein
VQQEVQVQRQMQVQPGMLIQRAVLVQPERRALRAGGRPRAAA